MRNGDPELQKALKGKYYCVFGIGSSKYKLFCKACTEIDELFEKNGAIRIMNPAKVDRQLPEGYDT